MIWGKFSYIRAPKSWEILIILQIGWALLTEFTEITWNLLKHRSGSWTRLVLFLSWSQEGTLCGINVVNEACNSLCLPMRDNDTVCYVTHFSRSLQWQKLLFNLAAKVNLRIFCRIWTDMVGKATKNHFLIPPCPPLSDKVLWFWMGCLGDFRALGRFQVDSWLDSSMVVESPICYFCSSFGLYISNPPSLSAWRAGQAPLT